MNICIRRNQRVSLCIIIRTCVQETDDDAMACMMLADGEYDVIDESQVKESAQPRYVLVCNYVCVCIYIYIYIYIYTYACAYLNDTCGWRVSVV
jgi:hypothetical protein